MVPPATRRRNALVDLPSSTLSAIRRRRREGSTLAALADEFSLSTGTVSRILDAPRPAVSPSTREDAVRDWLEDWRKRYRRWRRTEGYRRAFR